MAKSRFVAVPEIPQGGLQDWQAILFSAIKEDMELLIGSRGEADLASLAIVRGAVTVEEAALMTLRQITAQGAGYNISSVDVASLEDHVKLINDVTALAVDVATIRAVLNTLVRNLKGT